MNQHMTLAQEGPINTLALNKDCNKVVVTGRNIFRVCEIKDSGFVERDNIRTGKNSNLNFSCNDASWNPVDEQWLATAATNGAVVLWNIHKQSVKLKQETVYNDHKRTVNKVTFHSQDPNMLLSGSQDGTMKCFDIRMKVAAMTYVSNAESVRDVQFNPHQYHGFAAVSENGTVQLWDSRRPDRCEKQFTAHSGPVFACDWHPDCNWLATAGRDRAVKVWDLGFRPVLEYTVVTMASVGRIKWRPQRTYHIASCALVIDSSIHVWDIRRPYIPHASFNDHKDITTGIAWRGCPDLLLSTSKDSYLIQHVFANAERPTEKANPVCVSYNARGSLTLASVDSFRKSSKLNNATSFRKSSKSESSTTTSAATSSSGQPAFAADDTGYPAVHCSIYIFESSTAPSPIQAFRECARHYQVTLTGKWTLAEVCDHNASVALRAGRGHHVATIWRIVKLLFSSGSENTTSSSGFGRSGPTNRDGSEADAVLDSTVKESSSSRPGTRHQSGSVTYVPSAAMLQEISGIIGQQSGGTGSIPTSNERGVSDTSGGVSEEAESEVEELDSQEKTLSHIASGSHFNTSDFLFGDPEADVLNEIQMSGNSNGHGPVGRSNRSNVGAGVVEPADQMMDWILPSEAFQPRHEIKDRSPPPEHFTSRCFAESRIDTQMVQVEDSTSALLCLPGTHSISAWSGAAHVVEMLYYLAEEGDVQTAVTLVLVLGDRIRPLINESALEHWFLSYIDALCRCRLWNTAAVVTKTSPCESVQRLSLRSTIYHTHCNSCHRYLPRSGWLCDACKNITNTCSLCHLVVRGLYVWCRGCSHGGHLLHIREWFTKHTACPSGCGHVCEFE